MTARPVPTRSLICCPVAVPDPESAHRAAVRAAELGADLIEYRLDTLPESHGAQAAAAAQRLLADAPLPVIATCRPHWEGGACEAPEPDRLAFLESLALASTAPRYIDLELAAIEQTPAAAQLARHLTESPASPGLVCSTHDFHSRPSDLLRRVSRMVELGAAVHKIAFKARSLRDNLECFELLGSRHAPSIMLAMGESGLASRVLAPKFGAAFTFASRTPTETTAPGQPTITELLTRYRFRKIGPCTKVYGVIGAPVSHSLSPLLHNAAFDALHHDGVYLPLPVPAGWEHFQATIGAMVDDPALSLAGASITLPHKENALRFAKESGWEIAPCADRVGAVNTFTLTDDGWLASNTDTLAIALCTGSALGTMPKHALVLGAGGAARAAVCAFSGANAQVTVSNRTAARARHLAWDLCATACDRDDAYAQYFDVVINTTPVGMSTGPAPDGLPIDLERFASPPRLVFDTVYSPPATPLLQKASEMGLSTLNGAAMFVSQAKAQCALWTGWCPQDKAKPGSDPMDGLFDRLVRDALVP